MLNAQRHQCEELLLSPLPRRSRFVQEAAPTAFASASAHKGRGRCDGDGGRGFRGSFSEDIVIARFANITD